MVHQPWPVDLVCQFSVEELSASHSTDLQQRASELQAVVSLDDTIESIMPSDASCEDIEKQHINIVGEGSEIYSIEALRSRIFNIHKSLALLQPQDSGGTKQSK
ncbi:ap-4 complex subunit epsilon [Quercus suber]|uniref:Ap-4 complex subunit epsilon n=1 Tax=Quercus suber TaxID=58331 RepID=A0AAW0LTY4_QUESU